MERCEEKWLLAAYFEIERRIPPTSKRWKDEFEFNFFDHGNGVTEEMLVHINAERRRRNLDPIKITETDIFDYGRYPTKLEKSVMRRQMRDEYLNLDTLEKMRWKSLAIRETVALPPPHYTLEEYEQRNGCKPDGVLSARERQLRMEAIVRAGPPMASQPPAQPSTATKFDTTSKAIRQLKLVTNPETIAKIIAALSPDDALAIAESTLISTPELVDALVLRSVDA
jgi:hypothetical protein